MFNRIIVICTGNICRSPMAEALLKAKLADPKRVIVSAGIGALVGHPADPIAQELMRARGLDISGHRAQQATVQLLSSMDLILTMDETHSDWVAGRFPQLRGRVHTYGAQDSPSAARQVTDQGSMCIFSPIAFTTL